MRPFSLQRTRRLFAARPPRRKRPLPLVKVFQSNRAMRRKTWNSVISAETFQWETFTDVSPEVPHRSALAFYGEKHLLGWGSTTFRQRLQCEKFEKSAALCLNETMTFPNMMKLVIQQVTVVLYLTIKRREYAYGSFLLKVQNCRLVRREEQKRSKSYV